MTVDELLDQIDDMADRAFSLPLSGGRCVIDTERLREIIDDIRLNLPQEIRQAKAIVSDRSDIISTARKEADLIVRTAEERAKAMLAQEEIIRQAQQKANDMLGSAGLKSREMKRAANEYIDELMKRTDDALTANVAELRKARQALRNPPKAAETDE